MNSNGSTRAGFLPSIPISPVSHDNIIGHFFQITVSNNDRVNIIEVGIEDLLNVIGGDSIDSVEGLG